MQLRRQIFRQIAQIECRQAGACQTKSVQYGGKYASKCAAKALAVNCAVLPKFYSNFMPILRPQDLQSCGHKFWKKYAYLLVQIS